MNGVKKVLKNRQVSTKDLIEIKDITEYSIITKRNEQLVYFIIKPTNVSVLSESSLRAKIFALMNILKYVSNLEMICLNSCENFESNKNFLKERLKEEENMYIRNLLLEEEKFLNEIQVNTATSREFLICIRIKNEEEKELMAYLDRIEKNILEQGFKVKRADKEEIKKMLAIYYEQNVTTEKFEDYDGERWLIDD